MTCWSENNNSFEITKDSTRAPSFFLLLKLELPLENQLNFRMERNGITRVRCNLYRFNEETLGEPVTVRVFENFPHEWPRRAGISSSSSFEIQDTRPSPFTRGFLSFRANLFSFSQVFPFPCKWKSIPPRV